MNGKDFEAVMQTIRREMAEPNGVFQRRFGAKTPEQLDELMEIAGIALMAADRYYSYRTELEFAIREKNEHD